MAQNLVERLAQEFSPEASEIFRQIRPAYQTGYTDYVYGVDKEITIYKRRKNMEKSLRRMLASPVYYIMPLAPTDAQEVLSNWGLETIDLELYMPNFLTFSQKEHQVEQNNYFLLLRNASFYSCFELNRDEQKLVWLTNPNIEIKGIESNFEETLINFLELEKIELKKIILPQDSQYIKSELIRLGFTIDN